MQNKVVGWGLAALGAIAIALLLAGILQPDWVNWGGLPQLGRFFWAGLHPNLSPTLLQITAIATLQTVAYAICGTALSLVIGSIGGMLGSEVWWQSVFPVRTGRASTLNTGIGWHPGRLFLLARVGLAVPRAIHELIWGLLFVNLWGTDPLTAILAIAIPFGAIVAKVFSDILDDTPRTALQALLNSGAAPLPAFFYSILPQALLNLLSYAFYRFECSIRSATVLGLIGAGGLGYQLLLSLQSLQYEEVWTFIGALFGLNGLVDVGSAALRRRLNCPSRLDLNWQSTRDRPGQTTLTGHSASVSTPFQPPNSGLLVGSLVAIAGVVGGAFVLVNADFSKLWSPQTYRFLGEIVQTAFPPDLSIVGQLGPLALQTVAMSVLAIALAGLGGMLLAFPAARTLMLPGGLLNPTQAGWVNTVGAWGLLGLMRSLFLLCRAVPAPVWALVVLYVLFPGILPGAIALGIHNLGILGRLKTEVVENLDDRPLTALKAQGTPGSLVFLYGVLPTTLPRFVAYDLYRWEVCLRETAIVGIVGAGGLGYLMNEQLSSFDYAGLLTTLGCFLLLTVGIDWISTQARRSLR